MSKKILSLDFDGVVHKYLTPWGGATTIADGPVEGFFPFLIRVDKDFTVEIFSTRSETGAGRLAMAAWLKKHAIDYANTSALTKAEFHYLMSVVDRVVFPVSKPKAFVGLDDRILTFEGMWPSPEILLGWKPWNKRTESKLRLPIVADRESFYTLKALLSRQAYPGMQTVEMSPAERRQMEALRRLYDQIRDQEFPNV